MGKSKPDVVYQSLLFGGAVEVAGGPYEKVRYILGNYEEARDDDMLLAWIYWNLFDGMAEALQGGTLEYWFLHTATHFETIRRRRQELKRSYPPTREVQEYREKMSKAGPPGRRWR